MVLYVEQCWHMHTRTKLSDNGPSFCNWIDGRCVLGRLWYSIRKHVRKGSASKSRKFRVGGDQVRRIDANHHWKRALFVTDMKGVIGACTQLLVGKWLTVQPHVCNTTPKQACSAYGLSSSHRNCWMHFAS